MKIFSQLSTAGGMEKKKKTDKNTTKQKNVGSIELPFWNKLIFNLMSQKHKCI